jgi:hypothetical protein
MTFYTVVVAADAAAPAAAHDFVADGDTYGKKPVFVVVDVAVFAGASI